MTQATVSKGTIESVVLPSEGPSVRKARHWVRERLEAWGFTDTAVYCGELITSELAGNAFTIGQEDALRGVEPEPITVRLVRLVASVVIEVWDGSYELPDFPKDRRALKSIPLDEEDGRGLALVKSLAYSSGSMVRADGGKAVWAEVKEAA